MSSSSALLDALAADYWHALMARQPTWATQMSVHEHDGRLEDLSQEALAAWTAQVRHFLSVADGLRESELGEREQVTLAMLREELSTHLVAAGSGVDLWSVDQLGGPQVSLFDLVRVHVVHDAASASTWRERVRAMPAYVDQHADNIRLGLQRGLVASQATTTRVLEQLDEMLASDPSSWPVVTPLADRPPDIGEPEWIAYRADLIAACRDALAPAFERYRELLRQEVAPRARAQPGLASLPGGETIYAAWTRIHLGLDTTPDELHATGLSEVARIGAEMTALCAELFPGRTLQEALRILREEPQYSFSTREEVVEAARAAIRRATAAARECFDLLPDHECEVRPVDAHAEKSSPAAFYMAPAPDGTRPGTYYVNTCEPTSRPRSDAEVVAFHEAVPGHHLQIALAQKMESPEFQRHGHNTAYVEGWALYTERLAHELGLYSGALDRLGMLSCDALRACRLVVDTGLHAKGWTREQAIDYMERNTTNSLVDIRNEVDRYIAWPAQALSYKTGQLEILALRRQAESELGRKFRLGAFHAAVLEHGGVTLPVLRRIVAAYIERSRGAA
jgi:uncharacterized protein (DUF885 family)